MSNITRLTPGANNPAAMRDAAAMYIAAGVRVLPTEPNKKKPASTGWKEQATLDQTQLVTLWPDRANYGLGLAMGRWANTAEFGTYLVCIDLDSKPGRANGVEAWHGLVAEHGGDQGQPWVQITPSGGVHLVYQLEYPHTNGTGQLPDGIDVRGDGGQIIAHPTQAASGVRRWAANHAPWDHAPGFAPTWLQDLLQPPTPLLPPNGKHEPASSDLPGEKYNSRTNWADLLGKHGWRYLFTANNNGRPVHHYERPGQTEHGKTGGTLCDQSGHWGMFFIWSSSVQLPAHLREHGKPYQAALSPFAFYAAMEHGGDFHAASQHLAREQRESDTKTFEALTAPLTKDITTATDDEPEGYSVRFTNLGDYTGDLTPRKAALLKMTNGEYLLYSDSENLVWGAPGCGKSWLAVLAVLQVIQSGQRVLVIDYEMSQRDWVLRLKQAGATAEQLRLVEYIAPQEALRGKVFGNGESLESKTPAALVLESELRNAVARGPIALAVIDGVSEMLTSNNLASNDAEDIANMWNALPRLVTNVTGAAVLAVDHVPKQVGTLKQKDIMPFGSQHKLSRVKGAGFSAWATSHSTMLEFGGQVGLLHLHCKKDRHGGVGQGRDIATLEITPLPGGKVQLRLLPFDADRAAQGVSQHEQQLQAMLAAVHKANTERAQGKLGKRAISSRYLATEMSHQGHKMSKDTATALLVDLAAQGLVQNAGAGKQGAAGDWVPTNSDQLPTA